MKSKVFVLTALIIAIFSALPFTVKADDTEDYTMVIDDRAYLLTDSEEALLRNEIKDILNYGNVAFITNEEYNGSAEALAESEYRQYFGADSGLLLLIDMYNRRIEIFSDGAINRSIPRTRAHEITDNAYTEASEGRYYNCASKIFDQIKIILDGGSITTPMKYATNAAFALGAVLIVNLIIITSQRRKGKDVKILTNAVTGGSKDSGVVKSVTPTLVSRTKRRRSSSGGGGFIGGGGGGFSGGGGGGFSSGGGGGHSF